MEGFFIDPFLRESLQKSCHIEIVSPSEMDRITTLKSNDYGIIVVKMKKMSEMIEQIGNTEKEEGKISSKLVLILDRINDPGNLGTIIRIADWYGISQILCSLDTVDCYNPKVVMATMGSLARVRVEYVDLEEYLLHLTDDSAIPDMPQNASNQKDS